MRLRDLIDESTVKIGLESIDKDECLEELLTLLVRAGKVSDREAAAKALRTRENEASTGIGLGFAVPHGKTGAVNGLTLAIGTSASGIEFDAVDDRPVRLVCMILAAENEPGRHLQALAEIMRLMRVPGFIGKLAEAKTPRALLDILDAEE